MKAFLARLKAKWLLVWDHRTKALGLIFGTAGYVQNNYAQAGIHIPQKWEGGLLGVAGAITFSLGFYNWFIKQNPAGPPDVPSTPP